MPPLTFNYFVASMKWYLKFGFDCISLGEVSIMYVIVTAEEITIQIFYPI